MNTVTEVRDTARISQHAAADTDVVAIAGLRLGYAGKPVLHDLHWRLPPGQVVGLLGRNGAGKTTLLEALLGLREAEAGTLRLFGQAPAALDDAARARIGYVPQRSDLFGWLTAPQLLAYFRSFYPRWNDAKVEALLTRWGIDRRQTIGQLSGGQQQRLSIIRALGHEPDLLVLDEPVASLDPGGRREFLQELVEQVLTRATTVVFSTHILSDLERVAVDVAFLSGGRIAVQAPLDELIDDTRSISGPHSAVHARVQAQAWQVLAEQAMEDGRTRVLARGSAAARVSHWPGTELRTVSLEDLFLGLTL